MPRHHPGDEQLLAYAAGHSPEAVSLIVATHLALCPACRAEVAQLEALGGAVIEALTPSALPETLLQQTLSRIDEPASTPQGEVSVQEQSGGGDRLLPRPLRDYVQGPLDALPWRDLGPTSLVELVGGKTGPRAHLLRIEPGAVIASHAHDGLELALVLAGGISEKRGRFRRGDVSDADSSLVHDQVIEQGRDCLCLLATDGPPDPAELLGRLISRPG